MDRWLLTQRTEAAQRQYEESKGCHLKESVTAADQSYEQYKSRLIYKNDKTVIS